MLFISIPGASIRSINRLVDAGAAPNFQALIERGSTCLLRSFEPCFEPCLAASLATGHAPSDHGIASPGKLSSDGLDIDPIASDDWRKIPIWEVLQSQGIPSAVINWPGTCPAAAWKADCVSDLAVRLRPLLPDRWSIPDDSVSAGLATSLASHAHHWTHIAGMDVDQASRSITMALAADLEATSWAMQLCNEKMATFLELALLTQTGCESAPDQLGITLIDQMLGDLIAGFSGPIAVASAFSQAAPLGPSSNPEHRVKSREPRGFLIVCSSGVSADRLHHGGHILDVAPTIAHLAGAGVDPHLPGRVLSEIWESPGPPAIETWSAVRSRDAQPVSPRSHLTQQFVVNEIYWHALAAHTLGEPEQVVELLSDRSQSAALSERELELMLLACVRLRDHQRLAAVVDKARGDSLALRIARTALSQADDNSRKAAKLQTLGQRDDNGRHSSMIGHLLIGLGALNEAERLFAGLANPQRSVGLALVADRRRDWPRVLECSLTAVGFNFHQPRIHLLIAQALVKLHRPQDALAAALTAQHQSPRSTAIQTMVNRLLANTDSLPGKADPD